jgi:hypothetical protein
MEERNAEIKWYDWTNSKDLWFLPVERPLLELRLLTTLRPNKVIKG